MSPKHLTSARTLTWAILGFTFVAMTRFDSLEDVKYYDEECEAHKVLKAFAYDKVQQPWETPLTVFFED